MKKLKKVGFFRELRHGDSDGPLLKEAISKDRSENIEKILNYLHNGHFFIMAPSVVTDVLSDEKKEIGILAIQTDGVWAWPSDLTYYADKYGVSLPDEFIKLMANRGWAVGSIDTNDLTL
jgi:hypothetical protein